MINEMSSHKNRGILFVCDIDNFKSLNDTEGHIRGDAALIYLAGLMKRHAGSEVVISRLGGDEYMLFFPERENICCILEKMKKIQDDFADYMKEKYPMLDISFSAGGVKQGEIDDFNMLYRKADVQLYRAKERKDVSKLINGYRQNMTHHIYFCIALYKKVVYTIVDK